MRTRVSGDISGVGVTYSFGRIDGFRPPTAKDLFVCQQKGVRIAPDAFLATRCYGIGFGLAETRHENAVDDVDGAI